MEFSKLDRHVVLAQAGDQAALRQAFKAALPALQIAVKVRCPDPGLAEEVIQETLVTALEQLARYRPEGTFIAWLKGIARNHLRRQLDAERRLQCADPSTLETLLAKASRASLDVWEPDLDGSDTPPQQALRNCLEQLSPRLRGMLERRHVDQVPVKKLAQQYKQGANTIAVNLKRLRSRLRSCLQTQGINP